MKIYYVKCWTKTNRCVLTSITCIHSRSVSNAVKCPTWTKSSWLARIYLFITLDFGLNWSWGFNSVMVLKYRSPWLAGNCSLPELKTAGKFVSIRGKHQRTEMHLWIKCPVKKLESQPWALATMSKYHYIIYLPKYERDSWLGDTCATSSYGKRNI